MSQVDDTDCDDKNTEQDDGGICTKKQFFNKNLVIKNFSKLF